MSLEPDRRIDPEIAKAIATWLRNAGLLATFGVVAYVGESGIDGGFLKDLWAAAKTAGTFGCLFATLAWIDEKADRKRAEQQLFDRTIGFTESTNRQATANENGVDALKEMATALRSLTLSVRSRRR